MKARLNILGRKLEVVSIRYYQDKVEEVQVLVGHNDYKTYYNEKSASFQKIDSLVNMDEALEFPELEERIVDEWNKLIDHLEKMIVQEDDKLTDFAMEAMEGKSLPFSKLALIDSQKEYKLLQQRVLGIIDTVEEVKAFTEGYYAKVDDEAVEAEEYHQSIE